MRVIGRIGVHTSAKGMTDRPPLRYRKLFWFSLLALLVLLTQGLGITWMPATAAALTFWLVMPLVTYVAAGGMTSWQVNRKIAE